MPRQAAAPEGRVHRHREDLDPVTPGSRRGLDEDREPGVGQARLHDEGAAPRAIAPPWQRRGAVRDDGLDLVPQPLQQLGPAAVASKVALARSVDDRVDDEGHVRWRRQKDAGTRGGLRRRGCAECRRNGWQQTAVAERGVSLGPEWPPGSGDRTGTRDGSG